MDVSTVQFTRIMNFLLDKDEHREMPHQQLNSQANVTQTHSATVTETQPMWRRRFLGQRSPINSQTVCSTPGYNVSECLNGIQHSQNDVICSLSMGLCETGHLNSTSCVVPQTSPEDRASHSSGGGVSRRKRTIPNYSRNAIWCNKQTYPTPETGTANQAQQDEHPRVKRIRGPKPKIMYDGNGPMQLWQFILSQLVSSPSERIVEWTRERKYEFRILEPDKLAKLWGTLKKRPAMNFKKLARGLRYYYGKSTLEKVRGKNFTYEFVMDISKILGYDPVCENTEGEDSSATPPNAGFPPSAVPPPAELHVPDSAQQRMGDEGNGGVLLSKRAGSSGIKLFDFSVLVESNETSSFYEAL